MAFSVKRKSNINIGRVVAKVVGTVIALYVGGTIITELGNVMNGTMSPFYPGLTLIGWEIGDYSMHNASHYHADCAGLTVGGTSAPGITTCITDTGGTGILAIIGIVAIATIVTEFVEFSM